MAAAAFSVRIAAIQTVTPGRMVEAGKSRRITFGGGAINAETLQSHLRLVLYFKQAREEETAQTVAAWIKESLNAVLPEQPVLSGRLRKEGEGKGYWEVKFNDAGVRLVQAIAETTMDEVLGSKDRDEWESSLAYWAGINPENPDFSALFCIQVTEFQGDGYSIGISCSLLLADPQFLIGFIMNWVTTHNLMLARGQLHKDPMFDLGYFQRAERSNHIMSSYVLYSPSMTSNTTTTIFKVSTHLASACNELSYSYLEEVSNRLKGKTVSEFTLLANDDSNNLSVDSCCADQESTHTYKDFDGELDVVWWDELGLEDMELSEGNKAVHVSYSIISSAEKGMVVAMMPIQSEGGSELMISVTVPKMM